MKGQQVKETNKNRWGTQVATVEKLLSFASDPALPNHLGAREGSDYHNPEKTWLMLWSLEEACSLNHARRELGLSKLQGERQGITIRYLSFLSNLPPVSLNSQTQLESQGRGVWLSNAGLGQPLGTRVEQRRVKKGSERASRDYPAQHTCECECMCL